MTNEKLISEIDKVIQLCKQDRDQFCAVGILEALKGALSEKNYI